MSETALITTNLMDMTPSDVFEGDFITGLINEIRAKALEHTPDMTTDKGRKAIRSNAYAVRRTKTTVDNLRKGLTKEWKDKAKAVDKEGARLRTACDEIVSDLMTPLEIWEEAEENRIRDINEKIETIINMVDFEDVSPSADTLADRLKTVNSIIIDESYAEKTHQAQCEQDSAIKIIEMKLEAQLKYEADQAELAKLKKEAEERERLDLERKAKEEEERKAKEAEEARIKAAAEAKAKAEQDKKARLAREKQLKKDAAEKATRKAEAKAKEAAEKAESDRLQAIKDKEDAERRAELAAQAERNKIAAEQAAQAAADKRRMEDEKHRESIETDIEEDINEVLAHFGGDLANVDIADTIIDAMINGKIRHIEIKY